MSTAKKLIDSLKENIKTPKGKINQTYIKLVEIYPLQQITTKKQHELALKVVTKLISHSSEANDIDDGVEMYLKTLSGLVKEYEKMAFKSSAINGTEMLAYLIDLQNLNQSDLSKELGGQPVVSKILKGERELNLRQVKALAKRFKVSPEVFI